MPKVCRGLPRWKTRTFGRPADSGILEELGSYHYYPLSCILIYFGIVSHGPVFQNQILHVPFQIFCLIYIINVGSKQFLCCKDIRKDRLLGCDLRLLRSTFILDLWLFGIAFYGDEMLTLRLHGSVSKRCCSAKPRQALLGAWKWDRSGSLGMWNDDGMNSK